MVKGSKLTAHGDKQTYTEDIFKFIDNFKLLTKIGYGAENMQQSINKTAL